MYQQFFGFRDAPFSIAPNPQFLYMSARHQEALAHLLYGVQSDGGFILLTGEVGTGKTTLCRCLLEQIPEDVETAFVLNPKVTAKQLLASICDEFGIQYPQTASLKKLVDNLNDYLLACHAQHKRAVLIIDEAQNLSRDLLEQLRLLTNLETSERKLLQIILLGQPELLDMLAEDNLRQFSQRITARFHLEALNRNETLSYIEHRLEVVGGNREMFSPAAMRKIYRLSGGIPRIINLICDRALLGAYAGDRRSVDVSIIKLAAKEVLGEPRNRNQAATLFGLAISVVIMIATGLWMTTGQSLSIFQELIFQEPIAQEAVVPEPMEPIQGSSIAELIADDPGSPTLAVNGHDLLTDAYHDLFALWGTAFEERDIAPCELAASVGLGCYDLDVDLDQLAHINRPAIVTIQGQYLTLSAVTPESVTLFAGATQYDIKREQFLEQYNGSARLLWRTPPDYSSPLTISDEGAAVDWLVSHLSRIDGATMSADSGYIFNEALALRVRDFQASVGLSPNGVTDPLTWIHINTLGGVTVPRLQNGQG